MAGLDLLALIQKQAPQIPVVVMTAYASIALATEAIRPGVRDFLEKP